jgi:hypothetical protein
MAPTGTLMKKTQRQPGPAVSRPLGGYLSRRGGRRGRRGGVMEPGRRGDAQPGEDAADQEHEHDRQYRQDASVPFSAFFAATSRSSDDGSWTGGLPISLLSSRSLRSISPGSGWFPPAPPAISLSRLAGLFSCPAGSSVGRRKSPLVRTEGTHSSALMKRPD